MAEREFDNHKDIGGRVVGEHKHNPTAVAAKNGELPSKKKPMGTAESREWVYTWMREHTPLGIMEQEIRRNCDGNIY